jgi:hypothetical protein
MLGRYLWILEDIEYLLCVVGVSSLILYLLKANVYILRNLKIEMLLDKGSHFLRIILL